MELCTKAGVRRCDAATEGRSQILQCPVPQAGASTVRGDAPPGVPGPVLPDDPGRPE